MRILKIYFVAMLTLFAVACTHDALKEKVSDTTTIQNNQDLQIVPKEEALALLDRFLDETYPATKSEPRRKISTISEYDGETPLTKANDKGEQIKIPQAYLVNFEGEKGFAVLGANNKVPDIVAVTESGAIKDDLSVVVKKRVAPTNYGDDDSDFDEEPESNYCAEDDDYYTALLNNGNSRLSPNELIPALIRKPLEEKLLIPESNSSGDKSNTENNEEWKTFTEKAPLVNLLWGQEEPYNKYCSRKKRNVAVGCSNIALAMIMTTNEFPTYMYINGNMMDWKEMKKEKKLDEETSSKEAQEDITRLVWCIFRQVKKAVTKNGTLITPRQIRQRMEAYGYKNVEKLDALFYTYKMGRSISDMLAGNKPVFMSAIPGRRFKKAHSWVVDGAKYSKTEKDNYLLHCNWGWEGIYNGYFSQHCLKPERAYEYDNPDEEQSRGHRYNLHFRVITYDIPSQLPVIRSYSIK